MSKQVELSISINIITEKLRNALKKGGEPHADLVSKIIVDNLETTEMGLSQLVLSFMGIQERTVWVVGDECMVSPKAISSWRFEKQKMEERGMLYKGHVRGKIKSIDLRKKRAVEFEFEGVYSYQGKDEIKSITDNVALAELRRDSELTLERPDLADML